MAKIMICDDNKTVRTLLERRLTAAGHEVVGQAADGNDGISVYNSTGPELALLDVTMPQKDGRECLAGILAEHPKAKIIMVSAVQDEAVIAECIQAGAKAFISKDKLYNQADFDREVASIINRVLAAA